jgi:outer membrane protein OmpA-like peptidoglycan-associated protein
VKFGRLAELKLYVVGHTDTVGATAANRTLSLNRARAISAWFRRQGLKIPIYFDGLGEEALAVSTADEEAEAKNRRAEYIIAIDTPSVDRSPVPARWQRL